MKSNAKWTLVVAATCVSLVTAASSVVAQTIISSNSAAWKYDESGNYPGETWSTVGFDDSAWTSGAQPIGYGTWENGSVTEAVASTVLNTTSNVLYCRSTFTLTGVSAMKAIQFTAHIDDHAIVWLNGRRVWNIGMTNDIASITNTTVSAGSVEGQNLSIMLSPTLFNEGSNVLAIEVHNGTPSSDLFMQAMLDQIDPTYTAATNIVIGSNWKVNDFSFPGSTWTNSAFDDSSWRVLPGAIGFDLARYTNLSSVVYDGVSSTNDRKATYYLRNTFTVASTTDVGAVSLQVNLDDGAVIYLNGELLSNIRCNVGSDYTNYATVASPNNGMVADSVTVPVSALVNGTNTLAVELKQIGPGSSDIRFDAALSYTVVPGGSLSLDVTTANQSVPNTTNSITLDGTAVNVVGNLDWTNSLGGSGTTSASGTWTIPDIALGEGTNVITVTGTNAAGTMVSDSATIIRAGLIYTLDVTTANLVVSNSATAWDIQGIESNLVGTIDWANSAGGSGSISATDSWTIASVPLTVGVNTITVSGTNAAGATYSDSVTITRSAADYTAYDDTAWHQDVAINGGIGVDPNAVGFATNSPWGKLTGNLKSASDVSVKAQVAFSGAAVGMLARNFAFESGSDAETYFSGHIGVNNSINWTTGTVNMALSGLNPSKIYEVVIWSTRGVRTTDYSNRFTEIVMSGADSFNNGSSAGVELFGAGNTGSRVRAGDVSSVARYTTIAPGSDGQIDFALTAGADQLYPAGTTITNGYINAIMVRESSPVGSGDADLDGMDDAWETLHFGGTAAVNGGTFEDYDHDGSINYDEYRAGTDPTSSTSKLEFTGTATNAPGTVVLSWAGVNGKTYTVQGATTITSMWTTLQSGIAGVSPTTVYTGTVSATRNFMRVKVE